SGASGLPTRPRSQAGAPACRTSRSSPAWPTCSERHGIGGHGARRLRDAVSDLVVVALALDEEVPRVHEAGRQAENAGGDRDIVSADTFPEQAGAAITAEAA